MLKFLITDNWTKITDFMSIILYVYGLRILSIKI